MEDVKDVVVDEQVNQSEEPKVPIEQLMYDKLIEIQSGRLSAISDEDRARGARLLRSPYDDLSFGSYELFKEELDRIKSKTSKLSSAKRAAMAALQVYVVYDMMEQKEKSSKDEGSGVEVIDEPNENVGE